MKYFHEDEPVPAAAISYSGLPNGTQPLLFTTQYGFIDNTCIEEREWKGRPLLWVISSLKVVLVRDWSTSVATIILSVSNIEPDCPIPPLPNLGKIRGGNNPYLTVEDEIRIYAGYVDSVNTPITADLLDEHPIDLCPDNLNNPDLCNVEPELDFKSDPNKPLAPIFWGFIDSIQISGDIKGITCIIQARDRTRIFSDTKIIAIPALQGRLVGKGGNLASGNRENILMDVANAATGQLFTQIEIDKGSVIKSCWKPVLGGLNPIYDPFSKELLDPLMQGALLYTSYTGNINKLYRTDPIEDPSLWVRKSTHKIMHPKAYPRFHIWLQRPPLVSASGESVFTVVNKSPLDIVRFLADTEERPTDFFASHVNGDYVFGPRALDTSGFYDSKRQHRTYFFKDYPKDKSKPSRAQTVLSMRAITSSLGMFNRIIVVDSDSSGAFEAFLDNIQVSMEVLPWGLNGNTDSEYGKSFSETGGRAIYPPCRNHIIYDGNISSYGNKDFERVGGALIIALSQARTWSRELQGIQITIPGDPTFYPNEAIRVYNTILHDFATMVNPGTIDSEKKLEELQSNIESLASLEGENITRDIAKEMKQDVLSPKLNTSYTSSTANQLGNSLYQSLVPTNVFNNDLPFIMPTYKVRTIQHSLVTKGASPGFTTKLECIADY